MCGCGAFFMLYCCERQWGQVLMRPLSGTVGHCRALSGTVKLSGFQAVGILDSLTLLDRTRAWFLASLVEKWCRALSGMSGCRAVGLSGLSGSCQVPVGSCCRAVEPGLNPRDHRRGQWRRSTAKARALGELLVETSRRPTCAISAPPTRRCDRS